MSAKKKRGRKPSKSKAKPKKSVRKAAAKAKVAAKSKSSPKSKAKSKSKASAKKSASKRAAPKATASTPLRRRDGAGHLDPQYAKELRALGGHDDDGDTTAFVKNPRSKDDLAEELGEEFVLTATTGEDEGEDVANQEVAEELGGPFVLTDADTEFAKGTDASNPRGAKREPFPRT